VILIYNVSGILIGLAGFLVGFISALIFRSFGIGLILASLIWCGLGFWWRRKPTADGTVRPYPSIFFIPLPFIAIATLLIGIVITPVEFMATRQRENDPRAQLLSTAERSLSTTSVSGDTELATLVHTAVSKGTFSGMIADSTTVHVATSDTSVLALVKVSNLKKFPEASRIQMLDAIADAIKSHAPSQDKSQYIGVKGGLIYGALRTPTITTGKTTSADELRDYFASAPAPVAPTQPK